MTPLNFQASDWVYVPDAMGRIGQGYYQNKSNPSEQISVAEFESRRNNNQSKQSQNPKKTENSAPISVATPAKHAANDLNPWDNPVIGEQTDTSNQTPAVNNKTMPQKSAPKNQLDQEASQNPSDNPNNKKKAPPPKPASENREASENNNKVICTELLQQGLMSKADHFLCTQYAQRHLPASFISGYHFWAVPYVHLMRRSKIATHLILFFVNHRTCEVRCRIKKKGSGSLIGKMLCATHDNLCSLLGHFVRPSDYHALYKTE